MRNNIFLLFLLLGAVILGTLGGYFVFLGVYQEQFIKLERGESLREPLVSHVMQNWFGTAVGTVTERSGQMFTLQNQGHTLSFLVQEDALVQLVVVENEEKRAKIIDLEEIRLGDFVEIGVFVDEEGMLQGTSVTVFRSQ